LHRPKRHRPPSNQKRRWYGGQKIKERKAHALIKLLMGKNSRTKRGEVTTRREKVGNQKGMGPRKGGALAVEHWDPGKIKLTGHSGIHAEEEKRKEAGDSKSRGGGQIGGCHRRNRSLFEQRQAGPQPETAARKRERRACVGGKKGTPAGTRSRSKYGDRRREVEDPDANVC